MSDRPILFSAPMVRALLDGRKTMTRRIIEPHDPPAKDHSIVRSGHLFTPHHQVGDRLWARETWQTHSWASDCVTIRYAAEKQTAGFTAQVEQIPYPNGEKTAFKYYPPKGPNFWRPSIFMPRWASRLTLIVTSVKVEQLHDISKEDAIAEGIERTDSHFCGGSAYRNYLASGDDVKWLCPPIASFSTLWDSINLARGHGWETNPWVVAIGFKPVRGNIDEVK